ncbi:hypothetical protein R1sor_018989 [Riccia sorocarpa]|uniref:Uncharacterized protein n=1 Tax=Riccia sorocarpa TaxID=122646 RepID=A0ABD3IBE9_9MARC
MASSLQHFAAAAVAPGAVELNWTSSFCTLSRPPPPFVACLGKSIYNRNCALSVKNPADGNRSSRHPSERRKFFAARATGSDSDRGFSEVEVLDPSTGEYRGISGQPDLSKFKDYRIIEEDEEESGGFGPDDESEEELLKRFAAAVGLEESDVVGKMFDKMRNQTSTRIVKQLEEGVGDIEDLLMDMFGDVEEFQHLFKEVEKMIDSGDQNGAREILDGNYEALLEQLEGGMVGVEQAALLDILAHLNMRLGETDGAEQLLRQALEVLNNVPTEAMTGNILEHLGSMYLKLDKPRDALPLFERSLAIKKELQGDDVASIVRTMMGLANTYSELNMSSRSIDMYQEILRNVENALGPDDEDLAAPLMHLGSSLLEDGKVDEAEVTIQRALNLTEKAVGAGDGKYGVAACVLAQVKSSKGEFDAAVDLFKKGLQVIENSSDFKDNDCDESIDTIRLDFAALLNVLGRTDEMNEVLGKTDLKDKASLEYYASQQVEHLEKLAEHYAEIGELQKSEVALRRSLQLVLASVGPDAPQVSVILQLLAQLLHGQPDRQEEAEPLARESLRIREKYFGKDHISVGEACSFLASILHEQDRDEEAVDLMYRVVEIQEKEFGADNPDLEQTLDVLSMLLMNTDRYKETVSILEKIERLKKSLLVLWQSVKQYLAIWYSSNSVTDTGKSSTKTLRNLCLTNLEMSAPYYMHGRGVGLRVLIDGSSLAVLHCSLFFAAAPWNLTLVFIVLDFKCGDLCRADPCSCADASSLAVPHCSLFFAAAPWNPTLVFIVLDFKCGDLCRADPCSCADASSLAVPHCSLFFAAAPWNPTLVFIVLDFKCGDPPS